MAKNTALNAGQKILNLLVFIFFAVFCLIIPSLLKAQEKDNPNVENFWKNYFQGNLLPKQAFKLNNPGQSVFMEYSKYGEFHNLGEANYRYAIKDKAALQEAIGEGIYPNMDVFKDPQYRKLNKQGLLDGNPWEYVHSKDFEKAFYIWTQAQEDPGVRTFYTGKVLENAGLITQAIKSYYAAIVYFPHSAAWAADHSFVWYIAPTAISSIQRLCRDYPELSCELKGASFEVQKGLAVDLSQDIIKVNPGKIIRKTIQEKINEMPKLGSLKIAETRGNGLVRMIKFANGEWQMLVEGKPYFIKGITYAPTEVGLGPSKDFNFDARWMSSDKNKNGTIDAPYEAWVDDKGQGGQHKPIGDFELLKEMGINTIRIYAPNNPISKYDPTLVNKPLLRDLYKKFGIKVIIGDPLGAYTLGSGASWEKGTDYTDPLQLAKMKEVVRAKVMDLKDEPFVLMWVIGNENNLPPKYLGVNASRTNAASHPEAYARFINEIAQMIHEIDGNHPVAVGNLELGLIDYYKQYAPAIDILGVNSYRGEEGFGALFIDVKKELDKPVLITEYGCDAYTQAQGPDEDRQLKYLQGNLHDIIYNMPGGPGVGNTIGGVVFEYLDEWWKAPNDPEDHQSIAYQQMGQSPDGYIHEEWFGIAGQGNGKNSPFERHLRKSYYYLKNILNSIPE
ncbi:MAG: hypothetical protein HQL12_08310 [Candidatus Omnitrophica bacterium]|nr:hypothetical protein [Candidatus Omnitrophota bacterium]